MALGRPVGGRQAARRIPGTPRATAVAAAATRCGSGSKENKLLSCPPGSGEAPPPSPSSEAANVQTLPCHRKASLRSEK